MIGASQATPAAALPVPEVPRIVVTPTCADVPFDDVGSPITVTVRGYSFQPGQTVLIRWNGQDAPAPANAIPVGPYGTFESAVGGYLGGGPYNYLIEAFYVDQLAAGNPYSTAYTYFSAPCPSTPTVTLTPDCGPPGTPVDLVVQAVGFPVGVDVQTIVVDRYSEETIYGSAGPITVTDPAGIVLGVQATVPAVGVYRVIVYQVESDDVINLGSLLVVSRLIATAYFVAPCAQLFVNPTCGVEGGPEARYTIFVSGALFQPYARLRITFDPQGAAPQEFYVDQSVYEDGTFGPIEINPYVRGPGTYEIAVSQEEVESPIYNTVRTVFTVPCSPGTLTIDPTCSPPQLVGDAPRTFAMNVVGIGFQPNVPVRVTFDPDGLSGAGFVPEVIDLQAGADGTFVGQFPAIAARPANTYRVVARQEIGAGLEGVATFVSPCREPDPVIDLQPRCDREALGESSAYAIGITGRRFIVGLVEIIFDADGRPEIFYATAQEPRGRFETTINPAGRPAGSYRIVAQQRDANGTLATAEARFTVPCQVDTPTDPTLTITPTTASPGFVVRVDGQNFPAGETIVLRWSQGIGAGAAIEVATDGEGNLTRQVLIFPHDFTGPREMTAGTVGDPVAFPDARAPLLVSPGQGSPPAYTIVDAGPMDPWPIVNRR